MGPFSNVPGHRSGLPPARHRRQPGRTDQHLKGMSARGSGRVVTVASDAGRVGSSGQAVYSAWKGGLIAFTKTMAREMVRKGVILNCVCPGPTDTPMLRAFLDEGERGKRVYEALKGAIPMRRLGEPEDIPGVVAFVASDDAHFMTGQVARRVPKTVESSQVVLALRNHTVAPKNM